MRVLFERRVSSAGTRGPSRFMGKLVDGLRAASISVVFKQDQFCDIAITLPHWRPKAIGIPRVMRADGTMPGGSMRRRRRYARRMRRADFVVWQSEFVQRYASRLFKVRPDGVVIYNGDDPNKYKVEPIKDDGKFHVLLCSNWISAKKKRHNGKYRPEKRLDAMLAIAEEYTKKNPDVVFWVVGETRMVPPTNPNIIFLGRLKGDLLRRYQISANCMLHLGYFEWCPNVVVESLVAGTPVIALNNGAGELIKVAQWGEVLPLEKKHDVKRYRKCRKVPVIEYGPVYAALDKWCRCTEKRPAKELFIDKAVERYIRVFQVIIKRWKHAHP